MDASLPKTYKVAFFPSKGAPLSFGERDLQLPQPGHVLVKVEACGVCHSDAGTQAGMLGLSFPIVPGHEIIGRVVAVGDADGQDKVKAGSYGGIPIKVGDRVGGSWHGGHDGSCKACKKGLFQMCEKEQVHGVLTDGGYAEYVTIRNEAAIAIPPDVDATKLAPILCAGLTVFNAMRRQGKPAGSLVAIQGLGGLGHLAIQYARKAGYRVVALSSSADKEGFARKLGAHEYLDTSKVDAAESLQKLGGADMIVATAPNPKLISGLVAGLGNLGTLVILPPIGPVEIDSNQLLMKGASVTSFPAGHTIDAEEAIEFARLHGVECLVETFPLAEAQKAFDAMMSNKVRFRAVLTM